MKKIRLPGVSFPVSQAAMGCAYLGSREPEDVAFELLDIYYEAGGRFLNTAHEYGHGLSERTIGKWMRTRGVRNEMAVTSKIGEDHSAPAALAMHGDELRVDIDETLERLGYDCIEFCLLHLDDESVPVEEILDALDEFQRAGKILYYGCSNWSTARMDAAAVYAKSRGYHGFVMNEIEMNLTRRSTVNAESRIKWLDGDYIAWHKRTGMAVGAYSPLAAGALPKLCVGTELSAYQNKAYNTPYNREVARRLMKLSQECGHTQVELQIAYLLSQPYEFPVFPILGGRTQEQLRESLRGLSCPFTREMFEYLHPKEGEY